MREILGMRRRLRFGRKKGPALREAALHCATEWHWPVLPGVGLESTKATKTSRTTKKSRAAGGAGEGARACACPDPDCVVPGAHPFDPGLLAATTDPRMVRWWWTNRPDAPVL
ncbi:bifunctional DNA primase/polymerase, partial [Streptomyces sp. Act-28]